jgi:S-adenosylmethionine:tRNA ribosyltransferase-isomerase
MIRAMRTSDLFLAVSVGSKREVSGHFSLYRYPVEWMVGRLDLPVNDAPEIGLKINWLEDYLFWSWLWMHPDELDVDSVEAYDYDLPRELIAQHPVEHRIDARLMMIDRATGSVTHHYVRDLPGLINRGDALVLNNSKVIPARLVGSRTSTGGRWEGLFVREGEDGIWEVLSKTRGSLRIGETLSLLDREGREYPALNVLAKLPEGHLAVRALDPDVTREQLLERFGRVPLPPYIREGQMVDQDWDRYQTVYARHPGSVAAPTAGLHFTDNLIRTLQQKGIYTAAVTLHVGLGTFKPIASDRLSQHQMHSEWGELPESSSTKLLECRKQQGRVIAVGTTSVRVLESAAATTQTPLAPWSGETNIFIRPPYQFIAIDALMTNFHLPKSTLMALVCAFGGRELIMDAYRQAIEQGYRFYSYGDCMLIV